MSHRGIKEKGDEQWRKEQARSNPESSRLTEKGGPGRWCEVSGLAFPKPEKRGPKPRKPIQRSGRPKRSGKRIPRVTQTPRGKEEAALNDLFSRVIRARDEICRIQLRCTPAFERYSQDAAHLFPKGAYPRLRWDLRNAVGACRDCHRHMTKHPAEWQGWIKSRLNVQDWEDLMRIHLVGPSPDRAEVRATLTAALEQYRRVL